MSKYCLGSQVKIPIKSQHAFRVKILLWFDIYQSFDYSQRCRIIVLVIRQDISPVLMSNVCNHTSTTPGVIAQKNVRPKTSTSILIKNFQRHSTTTVLKYNNTQQHQYYIPILHRQQAALNIYTHI